MVNKIEDVNFLQLIKEELQEVVNKHKNIDLKLLNKLLIMSEYFNSENCKYIYFLKSELTGLTKIGVTGDLLTRVKSINSNLKSNIGVSAKLKLEFLIPVHHTASDFAEKHIHSVFKDNRKYGEWFDLDNVDDVYSMCDNLIEIDGTVIILNEYVFDNLERKIDFNITDYDLEKLFNIKHTRPFNKKENKILKLYNTVINDKINFTYSELKYTNHGITETSYSYPCDSSFTNLSLPKIKEYKVNKEEIMKVNRYLIKNQ